MDPYFSIVMPVYNNERYLPKAVESVLKQSFHNLELIIIDDGSTDQTGKIADALGRKDSRVQVIHQSNQWIYAAFNRGVQAARGKYTLIVNSDDLIAKDTLESAFSYVEKQDLDAVFLTIECCICDSRQNIVKRTIPMVQLLQDILLLNKQEIHKKWLDLLKSTLIINQANLYRTAIMKKHPFRNDWYGADTLFNISIVPEIHSLACIAKPLYYHMQYQNDSTMNASIGKYYSYEHDMFETFYREYRSLFERWGNLDEEVTLYLERRRMRYFTAAVAHLTYQNCPLSLEEKLKYIFACAADLIPMAEERGWGEELEARVLRGCQINLLEHEGEDAGTMQFLVDYLEIILRYEKDEGDDRKLEAAVMHALNPNHIGRIFYKKLFPSKQVGTEG
ncbi:MAG: glycosyltransferase family 2 protein [Hungatella sp.]